MRTTRLGALIKGVIPLAVGASLLSACMIEQILIGQWYSIDTPRTGGCQGLEWRFVVDPQRSIDGYLVGPEQQRIATLSGLLNADDSFQVTATDAGGRTADVTGQFTSQVSTMSIHGPAAGRGCDGKTFKLRLGSYFAHQGGGGGGGG